ncbi:PPK2 family polyphosphate kinase [Hydrogenophaga sp. 5NK40-0174]|uniref:PPK2 family polyphosphate kinase n=1 Tax=Hydrogenophaga sp. 5NK40-0174 TaxID=3127649 RepID=UPI0033409C53
MKDRLNVITDALKAPGKGPWRQWQVKPEAGQRKKADQIRLTDYKPGEKPYAEGRKAENKARVQGIAAEIDALQNLFFADQRFKMLVVLQGTDTAGKDGTVRGVFSLTSPLGVRTVGWKAPTEVEREHDFLWRIHQQAPRAGEIMVFNRSHYEDVLVPTVNGWISREETRLRYQHINDFERLLSESGTVVLKFMLHISKDEQRERLQDRLDDPTKHWKFSMGDLQVREQWDAYQGAYESFLNATSTPWAPWNIVPADSKTHRNLMVGTIVKTVMERLDLRFPPQDPEHVGLRVT